MKTVSDLKTVAFRSKSHRLFANMDNYIDTESPNSEEGETV